METHIFLNKMVNDVFFTKHWHKYNNLYIDISYNNITVTLYNKVHWLMY